MNFRSAGTGAVALLTVALIPLSGFAQEWAGAWTRDSATGCAKGGAGLLSLSSSDVRTPEATCAVVNRNDRGAGVMELYISCTDKSGGTASASLAVKVLSGQLYVSQRSEGGVSEAIFSRCRVDTLRVVATRK